MAHLGFKKINDDAQAFNYLRPNFSYMGFFRKFIAFL